MVESADLMLCFLSAEESDIELALQYWGLDSERRWTRTVQQIADGIRRPKHKVPELARRAATAYDTSVRCQDCSTPRILATRSDLTSYWGWEGRQRYVCGACSRARLETERLQQEEKKEIEIRRLRQIIRDASNEGTPFDYANIDYLEAIVAYGIMQWSDSAIADGLVGNPFQLALCPSNELLNKLLHRLFNRGVLILRTDTSPDAVAPETKDSQSLVYFPMKVNWQFAEPTTGGTFAEVFQQIGSVLDSKQNHPQYHVAVSELWWLLAEDEALRYLDQELASYRLLEFVAGEKLKQAVLYMLKCFSVPKVRYFLYRTAKNTAALASREGFTRRHALNTIPGSLIRDCDRALADNWMVRPYCLKWDEEEARLFTLLFDRVLGTGVEGFRLMNGEMLQQAAA